jgi:hypothetical protein
VIGRDRAKLGFFWRHAYQIARSGRYQGSLVNPDSGVSCLSLEVKMRDASVGHGLQERRSSANCWAAEKVANHARRPLYSPLWQADGTKTRRFAPIEFIGRHMSDDFFDYAIGDEVHELKGGDTAQGNALGTRRLTVLGVSPCSPGTLLGGYADRMDYLGNSREFWLWWKAVSVAVVFLSGLLSFVVLFCSLRRFLAANGRRA